MLAMIIESSGHSIATISQFPFEKDITGMAVISGLMRMATPPLELS